MDKNQNKLLNLLNALENRDQILQRYKLTSIILAISITMLWITLTVILTTNVFLANKLIIIAILLNVITLPILFITQVIDVDQLDLCHIMNMIYGVIYACIYSWIYV